MSAADNKPQTHPSDPETTGHEWDGIKEFNNPLPRWWLWTFYATIIWSIGYWILMPAWPFLGDDYSKGLLGYSQRQELADELAAAEAARSEMNAKLVKADLSKIEDDPQLLEYAMAGGRSAFGVNCAQCHGSVGQGAPGYPNLQDNDWLWGGTLEDISTTIHVGIRSTHEDTRSGDMPSFGLDETLNKEEIAAVADYVLSLSGNGSGNDKGAEIFAENCAACHGDDAKGNQEVGAPNLTDNIWLYGGDRATVIETITKGRGGVMPTWEGKLDEATIRQLAVYVHTLGGGE